MGYAHIDNLYKKPVFLETAGAEVYALEKIHGTSAHISAKFDRAPRENAPNGLYTLSYHAGGEKHDNFRKCFKDGQLFEPMCQLLVNSKIKAFTVNGEAYGAKQQGMKDTYGNVLKFVAFDVLVDGKWLDVPEAEAFCKALEIEFVHYVKGPNTLEFLNAQRDADSVQAVRNGMGPGKIREGIVVKPLKDVCDYEMGVRLIVKHKRNEFKETATPREVDPSKIQVLKDAEAIAQEWVVEERLSHVLDKLIAAGIPMKMESTGHVKKAMVEDIKREATGEVVWSTEAEKEIGKRVSILFKNRITIIKT